MVNLNKTQIFFKDIIIKCSHMGSMGANNILNTYENENAKVHRYCDIGKSIVYLYLYGAESDTSHSIS